MSCAWSRALASCSCSACEPCTKCSLPTSLALLLIKAIRSHTLDALFRRSDGSKMHSRLLRASLFVVLALCVARVQAHTIDLDAGAKECFFEDLHTEDKVRTLSNAAVSVKRRPS